MRSYGYHGGWGRTQGETEGELRPSFGSVGARDGTTVGDNDSPGDRESKTGAAAPGPGDAIEFPEHLVDICRRYALAVIRYVEDALVLFNVRGDPNFRGATRVNRSIVKNVDQDLFEQSLICLDEGHGFRHVDFDPEVPKDVLRFAHSRAYKVGDVTPVPLDLQET